MESLDDVMISFLSHVFFLISVVQHPYFHFAPSHEETNHYLLVFPLYSSPLVPYLVTGLSLPLITSLTVVMFSQHSTKFYDLLLK